MGERSLIVKTVDDVFRDRIRGIGIQQKTNGLLDVGFCIRLISVDF
jgi:hypothetical protein